MSKAPSEKYAKFSALFRENVDAEPGTDVNAGLSNFTKCAYIKGVLLCSAFSRVGFPSSLAIMVLPLRLVSQIYIIHQRPESILERHYFV